MAIASISVTYLLTPRVNMSVPLYPIGLLIWGEKSYYDIMGGIVKGSGISATIQPGENDSVLTRSDG